LYYNMSKKQRQKPTTPIGITLTWYLINKIYELYNEAPNKINNELPCDTLYNRK